MRKWRNCTLIALRAELALSWSAGRLRQEPFDEGSAQILSKVTLALQKIGEIGLASSGGYYRQHGPLPLGMGSRNGPSSYFEEEDDLNSEDAEVVQTWCRLPLRSWCTLKTVLSSSSLTVTALSGLPGLCSPLTPQGVEGDGNGRPLLPSLVQHSMRNLLL